MIPANAVGKDMPTAASHSGEVVPGMYWMPRTPVANSLPYRMWDKEYKAVCKKEVSEDCRRSVRFILSRNIVCGNALSLMRVDENQQDTGEPIVFSEWAFVTGYQLQRSDYTFARLMQGDDEARDLFSKKKRKKREEQMTLFDAGEPAEKPSDEGEFLKKYVTHYQAIA